MAIDFTLAPEHEEIRSRVRSFIQDTVQPRIKGFDDEGRVTSRHEYLVTILELREEAKRAGLWLPHMPAEWGGMGLGHVELAMVQAEAGRTRLGPWILNCMAPDEGNMHTLLHWATDAQKDNYLRRLCEGTAMSCFAMTEPEVAGSDPTLIQTRAEKDGDEWIINGHKWFISNARRAQFAILVARTEPDVPPGSRGANTAFLVDLPAEGWNDVREVETMHGSTGHSEIVIEDLRVHDSQVLGGRGNGHRLGQYRLGPARLAHCMRWIAQAETALDMMVDRSLHRYSHGSLLAEKQGVQWLIADSAMELYQCKLMVLHAAYKIDRGDDFRTEVSMAKHFVANSLNRIIDRSIQVHGALGLFHRHAPGEHAAACAVGPVRRRRRRDPPDADCRAHHRRLQGHRVDQRRHRRPPALSRGLSGRSARGHFAAPRHLPALGLHRPPHHRLPFGLGGDHRLRPAAVHHPLLRPRV